MTDEQESTTPGETQKLEHNDELDEACSRAGEETVPFVLTPPPPPSQ